MSLYSVRRHALPAGAAIGRGAGRIAAWALVAAAAAGAYGCASSTLSLPPEAPRMRLIDLSPPVAQVGAAWRGTELLARIEIRNAARETIRIGFWEAEVARGRAVIGTVRWTGADVYATGAARVYVAPVRMTPVSGSRAAIDANAPPRLVNERFVYDDARGVRRTARPQTASR